MERGRGSLTPVKLQLAKLAASLARNGAALVVFALLEHRFGQLGAAGIALVLRDLIKAGPIAKHLAPVDGAAVRAALYRSANHG